MKTKINFNCNIAIPKKIVNFLKNKDIKNFKKNNIWLTKHAVEAILDDRYFDNTTAIKVSKNFIDLIIENKDKLYIFEVVSSLEDTTLNIEKIGIKFKFKDLYINFIVRKINTNYGVKYKIITVWCNHISDKHQTLKNRWKFYKDLDLYNKSEINNIFFQFS